MPHRTLFEMRASESLIAPELLNEDLQGHGKDSTKKSTWKTGMGEFVSEGTVKISEAAFPSFTTQLHAEIEFDLLPRQEKNSHYIIVGMKSLKRLGIEICLKDSMIKWDSMAIPMVPKGHWTQQNADDRWRNCQSKDDKLSGEPELEIAID